MNAVTQRKARNAYKAIFGFDATMASKIFTGLGYTWGGDHSPSKAEIVAFLLDLVDDIKEDTQNITSGRLSIGFDEFGYATVSMEVLPSSSYED